MIKNFKPRLYQQTIFSTCAMQNTLVVLPTGLGKTNIFLMMAAQRLKQYPNSKIMLLGPTRPLIDQYYETFKKYFDINEDKIAVITGLIQPEKRADIYTLKQIIFSTPQSIENDIVASRIELKDFSLLGIDEAHRATGNYSYNFIAKQYNKIARYSRIIAMTASPGSDMEKITEVVQNLHIEAFEVRTENDPDVKPYIQNIEMKWIEVELSKDFLEIKKFFEDSLRTKLKELKNIGIIQSFQTDSITKKEILGLQADLQSRIASGERNYDILRGISLLAESIKLEHAMELLESQGVKPLHEYLQKIFRESFTTKIKAVKNLAKDLYFRSAVVKTQNLIEKNIEHPKLIKLKELICKKISKDKKAIIFTQFRDTGKIIVNSLKDLNGVSPKLFVGQMKKNESGLSQKKQKEMLDKFRENNFNILVSTSVGEEGLDIPNVNYVIFYEPIPSAIRHIQRKGRTGRLENGSVYIFMTKNTRDVGYKWSAYHKEKRMYRILNELKKNFNQKSVPKEIKLTNYIKEKEEVFIYADTREKTNGCIKDLIDMGVKLKLQKLEVGDYLLSSRVVVELKTVQDFIDSIVDGRLLLQLKSIRKYEKPVLIIEGEEDMYSQRNVHPSAIRGMISTITIDYAIPIIRTKNPLETANMMTVIAKREQIEKKKTEFSLHSTKPKTDNEIKEYVVSSLPGVGPTLAKPLLQKFKTIKKIVNVSYESLQKIDFIGKKKAKKIKDIVEKEYDSDN